MDDTIENIDDKNNEEEPLVRDIPSFAQILNSESMLIRLNERGFTKPTDVQAMSIPLALSGKDLVIQAKTGSGKTLAYTIPLLMQLEKDSEAAANPKNTFALVLAPTRELAVQIHQVVKSLSPNFQPVCVIGGTDMDAQRNALDKDSRIIVGTPGRILDMMRQRAFSLRHCKYVVLDEADEMLSMGFLEDVRSILSRLPNQYQGLYLSATITPRVDMMANSFLSQPRVLLVHAEGGEMPPVDHRYCEVGGDLMAKPAALCDLIETILPKSAIIFCNTKSDTQLVEALLRRRGFNARRINSDLSQAQRDRIMKRIRAGELPILVATDIAARGLDIEQIDLVINYSIHEQPELYVHRTGRTGRAGRSGRAISLVGPRDFGAFHFLKKIVEVDFQQIDLPSDAEVANARLTHLYEIIRHTKFDLQERDRLLARRLLQEVGGFSEVDEDLEQVIAKMARTLVEHAVQTDALSLDEELDTNRGQGAKSEEESGRPRDREHPRGERSRGERDRDGSRSESGRRDRRETNTRRSADDQRPQERPRQENRRERTGDSGGNRPREHRGGRQENQQRPRLSKDDEVRLYIGQGAMQGMTAELFSDLAAQFAGVRADDLRLLTIRQHYGFVDVYSPQAMLLVKNLNGIEYNGLPLAVELSTVINRRPRRRDEV